MVKGYSFFEKEDLFMGRVIGTILSIIGAILALEGIKFLLYGGIAYCLVYFALGVAIIYVGLRLISNNKEVLSRGRRKVSQSAPPMPSPLDRIRFIKVDYVNWRNRSDTGTLEYSGTVSWSPLFNCWEIFIDNCTFADNMIEKKNYRFLDANKNILPMQDFTFSEGEVKEGAYGWLKIYNNY